MVVQQTVDISKSGIYRIVHVESGRAYVGQSIDVNRRWGQHRSALQHDRHHSDYLQKAWVKHGADAFAFELLEECDPNDLTAQEQVWMDRQPALFNSAPAAGSVRGIKRSAQTRALMVESSKSRPPKSAETRAAIAATLSGRKLPPERVARMAAAARGRTHSDETKARLREAALTRTAAWGEEERSRIAASGWTPERRATQSQRLTGVTHSPELRAAISEGRRTGKVDEWTPERRARHIAQRTGLKATATTKAKMIKSWEGRSHSAEHLAYLSESLKGNQHALGLKRSPETLAKMSAAQNARRDRERAEREAA